MLSRKCRISIITSSMGAEIDKVKTLERQNRKVDKLRPTAQITITIATTKNSPTIKDEIFSLCTEIHHTRAILAHC